MQRAHSSLSPSTPHVPLNASLNAHQKIEALRQRDSDLNRSIHSLIDSLNG